MKLFKKSLRSPAEDEAICKGILATVLTDSLLFGWLFTKKNSKYDFEKRRLK